MNDTPAAEPTQPRHLLFDIETNGLMPGVSKVHCIGIADVLTGELFSFPPDNIEAALAMMYDAEVLSGHNIIAYDYKVLKKLYNWDPRPGTRTLDTMVIARLMHSDIKQDDFKDPAFVAAGGKPGGHRLKDWGIRLGEHKAEYDGGWEEYTPEMMAYMMQDVRTNVRLLQHLKPMEYPRAPLDLEHRVAAICETITENGWPFDVRAGADLHAMLCQKRDELSASLIDKFGSWQEIDRQFIAKRDNKPRGIVKGQTVTTWKTVTFNPGSRVHIEKKLREAGWEPEQFTPTGRALLNDEVLETIELPAAKELIDFLLVQKRIGQIAEGSGAWMTSVEDDGRIHGKYNPMGTPHSRASHYGPNMAQVPNEHSLYGPECRALFGVPKGWKLVGADMAGCQLRVLGHYIAFFDKGEYAKIVTEGDIHTYHMQAAAPDIKSRDNSKTTIYALIFGAGPPKLGAINGGDSKMGARIKRNLVERIPGFSTVVNSIDAAAQKGWLKGLDGRRVPVRSKHSALNYLIASGEAILCKRWLADASDRLAEEVPADSYQILGWIHDEVQVACKPEWVELVSKILVECAEHAGDDYGFKTKLSSSAKVGDNWKETH